MHTNDSQRLFRLTSQSNDGVFSTLMDEDIQIPAGSSLALQSAAFDRQSTQLVVNTDNREVNYGLLDELYSPNGSVIANWKTVMPIGTFTQVTDGETLMTDIAERMNAVTSMSKVDKNVVAADNITYSINKGAQWNMKLDGDGHADVQCRTQDVCRISDDGWSKTSAAFDTTVYTGAANEAPIVTAVANGGGYNGELDFIARPAIAGTPYGQPNDYNSSYVWGKVRMNKGTGCIRVRAAEITDTTGTVSFSMGLVLDKTVLEQGTITNANIHYGLRCMGVGNAYESKIGTGGVFKPMVQSGTATPFQPLEVGRPISGAAPNDVLEIRVEGFDVGDFPPTQPLTQIAIQGHQEGGIVSENADSLPPVRQDADWYYFVAFHRSVTDTKLDMVEADLDSYEFNQNAGSIFGQTSPLLTVVRSADHDSMLFPQPPPAIELADRSASVEWKTPEVAAFFNYASLGTREQGTLIQTVSPVLYNLLGSKRAEFSVSAKNYIVLFDNVPLNSYDTYSRFDANARNANSGGSRRDILATIPVKEDLVPGSTVTRIAYEPSSLNFIDLANRNDMITRSLKCRILTSTYNPVQVDGMANLTVLMKSA